MRLNLIRTLLLFLALNTMYSCSSDSSATPVSSSSFPTATNYSYNSSEIQTMDLINNYRVSIGLNALEKINYISLKSEQHNNYMITNNVVITFL